MLAFLLTCLPSNLVTSLGSIKKLCDPLRGRGGVTKKITKYNKGGGGVHQKITEDHDHREGGGGSKNLGKLLVFIKEIVTPRINYQWVVQEVIY